MTNQQKHEILRSTLATLAAHPSFPPTNPTNVAEGADGDALCPFRDQHTKPDADPDTPTMRIWLDRPDPTHPENGGKVFLSCRHESCQQAVWELTSKLRREIRGKSPVTHPTIRRPDPQAKMLLEKKAKAALAGKEFLETILNDSRTLNTTEEDIMKLSPLPIKPGGAEKNPFSHTLFHLALFADSDLLFFGDCDDAKNPQSIRTSAEWQETILRMQTSPVCQEDPSLWPWPGHFTTGSTYHDRKNGRNLANFMTRRFAVCESDGLPKKHQLRVIRTMIADKRFPIAYVLHSGGKSYHVGIRTEKLSELEMAFLGGIPGSQAPKEFITTRRPTRFGGMNFDHATLRETQPCRIAGPLNPKSGKMQRLLYIDPSLGYEA